MTCVFTPSMTLVSPVIECTTVRLMSPSALLTSPVVVYCMPGLSGNHLLSTLGDDWNWEMSKLIAEPGPQSSFAPPVPAEPGVADPEAADPVGEAAADVAVGAAEPVVACGAVFCWGAQDVTVASATRSATAEPVAVGDLESGDLESGGL